MGLTRGEKKKTTPEGWGALVGKQKGPSNDPRLSKHRKKKEYRTSIRFGSSFG